MKPPRVPPAKMIDAAAERLAKAAGVPVSRVDKKALRKIAAKGSDDPPPVTLP